MKKIAWVLSLLLVSAGPALAQGRNDVAKQFYPDGVLQAETPYKNGRINGTQRGYYPNGKLYFSAKYKDGKPDGEFTVFYRNGKLKEQFLFADGKRTGVGKMYYENGNPMFLFGYMSDSDEFDIKQFYDDGSLMSDGHKKNGRLVGTFRIYSQGGGLRTEIFLDDNGKEVNRKEYRSSPKPEPEKSGEEEDSVQDPATNRNIEMPKDYSKPGEKKEAAAPESEPEAAGQGQ